MDEYQELLEDLHDFAVIAERRDEPSIGMDKLKKKLKYQWYFGTLNNI